MLHKEGAIFNVKQIFNFVLEQSDSGQRGQWGPSNRGNTEIKYYN